MIVPCFADDIYQSCTTLIAGSSDFPLKKDIIYSDQNNVKSLTQHFCQKVVSYKCMDSSDWDYAVDFFDASQSMFLSVLCTNVWLKNFSGYDTANSILKKQSFVDFGMLASETGYWEDCHNYGSMNNCDFASNLPQIFNKIMNDLFSIRQARALGVNNLSDTISVQDYANNFSKEKFPWLVLQKWLENGICDDNSPYYKTTCSKLKNYMTDAVNLLKNTEVVDVSKVQEMPWPKDCENFRSKNILYCGLLWTNSDYNFVNAVYNEYFWYNLFLSYYSYYINWSEFLDKKYSNELDALQENYEKIYLVQNQLVKSKQAITLSLRNLAEISYSFPLHVGFLMYQEDSKLFMDRVSKIYSPLRTLYDKLRNVQIKET